MRHSTRQQSRHRARRRRDGYTGSGRPAGSVTTLATRAWTVRSFQRWARQAVSERGWSQQLIAPAGPVEGREYVGGACFPIPLEFPVGSDDAPVDVPEGLDQGVLLARDSALADPVLLSQYRHPGVKSSAGLV